MPSLATCIFTFVVAVCVFVPGVLSGIILVQNTAKQVIGFIGKPLTNGVLTTTIDVTKAVPVSFSTGDPFGIMGFGGGQWSGHHSIALAVNSADAVFSTPAHRGSLVASSLSTPANAVPAAFTPNTGVITSSSASLNRLETNIFHFNPDPLSLEITAKWVAPNGGKRNVVFIWDSATGTLGAAPGLTTGLTKVRLFLIGSTVIPNIVFDPHFLGFNGDKYNVQGKSDTWFNLITDHDIQVNGFFQSIKGSVHETNTYIRALGVALEDHTIYVNSSVVEVDGVVFQGLDDNVETELTLNNKGGASVATILCDFRSFTIRTSGYLMIVSLRTTPVKDVDEFFLNVDDVELFEKTRTPHGLLGQTANYEHDGTKKTGKQGEGEIEGVYTEYKVSSAFGTDFKYNKFQ